MFAMKSLFQFLTRYKRKGTLFQINFNYVSSNMVGYDFRMRRTKWLTVRHNSTNPKYSKPQKLMNTIINAVFQKLVFMQILGVSKHFWCLQLGMRSLVSVYPVFLPFAQPYRGQPSSVPSKTLGIGQKKSK